MFKKALIASTMLVSAIGANAAETAAFGITGGSAPSSCNITLGNAGSVDYTTLTYAQMQALQVVGGGYGALYKYGDKLNSISVTCGAATSVKLAFTDNKAGKNSVYGPATDVGIFGLVDGAGTSSIGGYDMQIIDALIDGAAPAGYLHTVNGTTAWTTTPPTLWTPSHLAPGHTIGFIKTVGNTVPSSFTTLTGTIRTIVNVNKNYMDSATNAVVFNGGGVITLTYL